MRIDQIRFKNLKGQSGGLQIGKPTLLVGQNGSGKTARLQAVMIAMLGHEPSLGKTNQATFSLSNSDHLAVGMIVNESTSEQFSFDRIFTRGKSGNVSQEIDTDDGGKGTNTDRERVIKQTIGDFPLMFNPQEFLSLSPDKRREWMQPYLNGGDDSDVILPNRVVFAFAGQVLGFGVAYAILKHGFGAQALEELEQPKLGEFMKQCLQEMKGEAPETMQAYSDDLVNVFSEKVGTPHLQTLSRWLDTLKALASDERKAKTRADATVAELTRRQSEMTAAVTGLAETQEQVTKLQADLSAVEQERAANDERSKRIDNIEGRIGQWQADLNQIKADLADVDVNGEKKKALDDQKALKDAELATAKETSKLEKHATAASEDAVMLQSEIDAMTGRVCALMDAIKSLPNEIKCPECGTEISNDLEATYKQAVEDLSRRIEKTKADHEKATVKAQELKAKIDAANDKIQQQRREADEQWTGAEHLDDLEKRKAHVESEILKLRKELTEIPVVNTDLLDKQIVSHREQLAHAQELLNKKREAKGTLTQIEQSMLDAQSGETRMEAIKLLTLAVKSVRNEYVNAAAEKITAAANEMLQVINPKYKMDIILEDDKGRDVFDFTLSIDGVARPLPTLSGGETILAMVALTTALINLASPPLRVLLIEAAETDPANLTHLLEGALHLVDNNHLDNVIVASCHGPAETVEGWNVVEMGGGND